MTVEPTWVLVHSLADIALDRACACVVNGESCPGHAFLKLWELTEEASR